MSERTYLTPARRERLCRMVKFYTDSKTIEDNKIQEWFLNHPEFSFEWFETGRGSMFHARNAVCARMAPIERLALVLELFGIREVRLWTDLGWDFQRISLAILRKQGITKPQAEVLAKHLGVSKDWLYYGQGNLFI